jgi:hypothetical protein
MDIEKLSAQKIASSIYMIRGQKVMLDADLAALYGVETKYLKRQVNRNAERFPLDFMFRVTQKEKAGLRCQIGTLDSPGRARYSKYLPYAFTEHGILMLSSVLSSRKAIQVNIVIMRAFVKLREILSTNKALAQKFLELERKVGDHDEVIRDIVAAIRKMMTQAVSGNVPMKPKGLIGFQP